jgi:hypothetical protein
MATFLGWLLSAVFALLSATASSEGHTIAAAAFGAGGLLSCPPVWTNARYKRFAPIWLRATMGAIAFVVGAANLSQPGVETTGGKSDVANLSQPALKTTGGKRDPKGSKHASVNVSAAPQADPSPASEEPSEPASNWGYSDDKDEMRGTTTRYASLTSTNDVSFGFPYAGGKATLVLRQQREDGLRVILHVEGQFLCSSFRDDSVAVKFDDDPIEHFRCLEPSDGSTGVIFIRSEARFVAKLKKARAVVIEAEFFQEGRRQMQFDVAGLKWD